MSAALAIQKAIRASLVSSPEVTGLVPSANILDRNSRPAPDPSIIIGEDQVVDGGRLARDVVRVYATIHVWKKESGLGGVKAIAGAVRNAVRGLPSFRQTPYQFGDSFVSSERFLRDPDGETSHAVITVEIWLGGV